MAKKKKNLSDAEAYEAFLNDQNKQKEEQAKGQVRYREAAQASRVQYTNPTYTGKSKTGNYKWETNALKDYKMPKGMGKSYNDKFDYMTQQMGMTPGQAEDFRRYMDFQEDRDKSSYELKKREFKKDDKGNLVEDADGQWKLSRSTYSDGTGLHTKGEIIDGILSGMTQRAVESVKNTEKRNQEKAKEKADSLEKTSKERDGFLGFLDSTLGRASRKAQEIAFGKGFVDSQDKNYEDIAKSQLKDKPKDKHATQSLQMLNTTSRPADGKLEKAADFLGAGAGYIAPYTIGGAYGAADAALGKLGVKFAANTTKGRIANDLVRGALAGTVVGAGREATHKVASDEKVNPWNIVIEAASAGAGDAALGGVIRNLHLGRQADELLSSTGSAKYSDEAFQNALKEAYAPKGNASNVLADAVEKAPNFPDPIGKRWNITAPTVQNSLDSFTTRKIPNVEEPAALDDLFNFAQSGQGPQARSGIPKVENMGRYTKEHISNQADEVLNRVNQLNNKPKGYYENRILEVQKAMKENKNLTPEQEIAYKQTQDAWDMRKANEDAFVEQELAPFYEVSQQQAESQAKWQTVKKETDQEIKRIQGTYGRIKIPKGAKEDYPIPHRFKAAEDNMLYDDIYSFADQEGFSSADEAIQYLKNLDEGSNVKLKDMMPEDSHVYKEHEWKALEDAARERYRASEEGQALDKLIADSIDSIPSKDFDALYTANKGANDPASFDELVRIAQMEANNKPKPASIKDVLRDDPRVAEAIRKLDALGGKKKAEFTPNGPNVQSLDEMLSFLEGKTGRTIENAPTPGLPQNIDEILKNVNNSQVKMPSASRIEPPKSGKISLDEFNRLVRGEQPKVQDSTPDKPFTPLVHSNLQRFNTGSTPKLFTDGVIKSEKAIDTTLGKYYEGYVNSNHSFKAAHEKVLKSAIEKAKAENKPKKAAQLEGQLNELKKSGSKLEQSVSNEASAGVSAKSFLKRHFKELDGVVKDDAEMSEALTYMFAKDLKWRKDNGLSEYQLPEDVDWGQINDIINRGDLKDHFKNDFVSSVRNLTQEWRDIMLDSGLINKTQHEALSKNPYYMPLQRDLSGKLDNIDRGGVNLGGAANRRASGPSIVHTMGKGDLESFYKNPIETLINNTFAVYKNAYKEETHRQILNLAKLDKDGMFFKEISAKQYQTNSEGGIKIANDGNPRYVRIQKDLMKVMDENDEAIQTDVLGKLTNMFAGLKTRSLEYQMTAAYRDLATNYLTSQITNPFRYIGEAFRSIKNGNKDVKAIGGYFDKSYNEHTAGIDPEKIMNEFKRSYGGTVETFNAKDPKSWRKAAQTLGKYLDMPFKPIKKLGEITDEIPRDIEAKETERLFMKKNGDKIQRLKTALEDVNSRLAQTEGINDPFDPRLQGVDKLQSQKAGIERILSQFDRDLNREKLYRSRDVINYQRHGRGGVAKKIRQWVVFANTTTQSKDKVIRSFIERPGATLFKTALLMSPFITAQKIMHANMSDSDKQTYDAIPNYVKQMNYVYINDGKLFTVPKVQELALLSDPIEALLQGEPLDASARMGIKETVPYQAGNFAQGLVPAEDTTPIQNMQVPGFVGLPMIDTIANSKTGFNQKPVSFGAKFNSKDAKANDWTLDVYKKLMGDKPGADRLQYLTEQYLGDYGKYSGNTANYLAGDKSSAALDALIQAINPIQDRYYNNNGRFVKPIPQETKKK